MGVFLGSANEFGERFFEQKEGRIVIDFSDVTSRAEAALKIGRFLKGTHSPTLIHGSFDALRDVVGDWVRENATKQKEVFFLNCDKMLKTDKNLLLKLALNISSAFMDGIAGAKIENDEFDMFDGINNIKIYFILND